MTTTVLENVPQWPHCLHFTRVNSFGFPLKPVYIGTTETGIETRQKISDVPRGAYIEADVQWVGEGDGTIALFYEFLHSIAQGSWQVFRIDESNITCLIPGWSIYTEYLPTPLWRIDFDTESLAKGFPLQPDGCCYINFSVRLINVLDEYTYYDQEVLQIAIDEPALYIP
jgi:hypothetical protein